jgi:four helix bundle protein
MGRGRLKGEFLERVETFSERCVALAEHLQTEGRFLRVVDQLAGAGTSVGCNIAEASEALSVRDFRKCLGVAAKELAEARFLIRLVVRRSWVTQTRVDPLLDELEQIKRIVGALLTKTASPSPT